MKKQQKEMSYLDSVHRAGRIWNLCMMLAMFLYPILVGLIYGAAPDGHGLVMGLIATAPMYWAVGVVETFTYVPMLGAGGSYLSFVTGNISNLKLPVALNALEQTNANIRTEEGEIVSTVAIAVSSIVTMVIMMMPKCTGFTPSSIITGSMSGVKRRMFTLESMNMPVMVKKMIISICIR